MSGYSNESKRLAHEVKKRALANLGRSGSNDTAVTREQVYGALLNVLANAANYPEERDVSTRMLGLDVKPLTNKATNAVMDLLKGEG